MITWVVGPLAFPASEDWKYWTSTCEDGAVRAWYFPTGLPGSGDVLLGEFLDIMSAQDSLRSATRLLGKREVRTSAVSTPLDRSR